MRGLFVGAGQFASIQLDAWSQVPEVEIVGLVNRTLPRARELAARHHIPVVGIDLTALLGELQPDFVDICTAVETHLPLTAAAVAAGVPVLCQKPMAPTLAESRELARLAAVVPVMINDNWRWQAWYREIRRLLDAGALGAPQSCLLALRTADGAGPEPYARQPYFRTMERFLVFETGIHYLDTLRFLFGEVTRLHCVTRRLNPVIRGEDAAVITLEFASGLTAVWDGNRVAPFPCERPPFNGFMRLDGAEATLEVDPFGRMTLTPRGGPPRPHSYTIPPGYRGGSAVAAQRHFIECLRTGTPFETSAADYLRTTELVFAAYESAERHEPVALASP
jgi:predicted dehydrogenase